MRPAIALSPSVGDVLNAPRIQMAALSPVFSKGIRGGLCYRTIIGTHITLSVVCNTCIGDVSE